MQFSGHAPTLFWLACGGALALAGGACANAPDNADLARLSIEELGAIQVTSVSKRPELVGEAPSAIYVITREAIIRSGPQSVPEILRLAPNLQVYQAGASRYVITARGMNGAPAAQNFANKLLVLIDGRTVYTPLYSGVYWDMQDVLPHDIERIEVISGPGATLWGSNAVNGVVNITTRASSDTQGGRLTVGAGDRRRSASLRYGGTIAEGLTYRVYAKTFLDDDTQDIAGASVQDHWSKPQVGFRVDWRLSDADTLTFQGDAYKGFEAQRGLPAQDVSGGNLTAHWSRTWENGSNLRVQAYYDRAERGDELDGSGFFVDTYDADIQHSFDAGAAGRIVWGGGYRLSRYRIDGTAALQFDPASRDLSLFNIFVQDTIALGSATTLVLGAKLEDGPFTGAEILPNARLSWTPTPGATFWGAVSRAVRAPTPFDTDVVENLGGVRFLVGDREFRSETLTAYEMGAKLQPSPRSTLSISAFYNAYDDLRSIEIAPGGFLPLRWGNRIEGHTYGAEAWGAYQVTDGWRLSGAVSYLDQDFEFQPGASGLLGLSQVANDPKYHASLTSSLNITPALTLDTALRYVSAFPEPRLPGFLELDGRLGWDVNDQVRISVSGRNLLHERRRQYTDGSYIPRSVFVDLLWRF